MKKIKVIFISLLFLFIFTGMISLNNIYGVSSTISGGNVNQGNQITVKVSFSGDVCAANFNLSYDKSKLELVSGDPNFAWVEGENLPVYTFKAKSDATGNASISLSGQASDTSYIKYPLTGNGNINITAKQNESSNSNVNSNTKNNNTTAVNKSVNKSTSTQNNNTVSNIQEKDSNVYLSNLQVNKEGLTPNFNKYKTSYAITVGEDVSSLNVIATPEVATSKVSISGNTELKNGDNKIYVTVTAENGSKRIYTITVTKTGDPVKSNSYLENLIVENATMSPEFSKEVFEYDCGTVGASVKNLKILAFGENENVKVEIIGNDELKDGENTITVKVTSEDGTTTKEYVIKVKKDSSIVEEEKTEEINALENTDNNGFKTKIKKLLDKLKNNWLLVLMYVFCLLEFFEIIYLYRRQGKKDIKDNKKEDENADKNKKRAGANKFSE